MEILARAVGRRKEAVAQVQLIRGTGQFFINTKSAHEYLQNDSCSILDVQAPFDIFKKNSKGLPSSEVNNLKTNSTQSSEAPKTAFLEQGLTPTALNQVGFAEPSTNKAFSASEFSSNSTLHNVDTIVKVKGGGLKGQAEAIRLGIARALCVLETHSTNAESLKDNQENNNLDIGLSASGQTLQQAVLTLATSAAQNQPNVGLRKQLKDKGYLTQDSRVKERRKYGLKKARKASQYHKR